MRHLRLPENEESVTTPTAPVVAEPPKLGKYTESESRRSLNVKPNEYVYVAKITASGSAVGAWIFLTHSVKYDQNQFDAMVRECREMVNTVRIPTRIAETAKNKVPIEDPVKTNESLFEMDADFIEVMLSDKFGFKKLYYTGTETDIDLTIKGV